MKFSFKNWKTTLFGAAAGTSALIVQNPEQFKDMPELIEIAKAVFALATLLIGYFAKDKDKSGEKK